MTDKPFIAKAVEGLWMVVVFNGYLENGKKRWKVFSEHTSHQDASLSLERAKTEGFMTNLVHFEATT